jgi:branched-chain amino acid transport system ATP-binding protein
VPDVGLETCRLETSGLETCGLVSGYGRIETLHGVDLNVPHGQVTTIIGPNGSGKSTLLKTVGGLIRAWSGLVRLGADDITGRPAHTLVRQGMCLVPQGRVVFPALTIEENLRACAFTVRSSSEVRRRVDEAYAFLPRLAGRRRQPAGSLSGGEQVMLSLAKVIMLKPRILLLDEPSLGLSPGIVDQVYDRIVALASGGLTTIVVEQNVRKALAVADHAAVLVLGTVRYQGSTGRLENEVDLSRLFLEGNG